jgi:hypothetical protein
MPRGLPFLASRSEGRVDADVRYAEPVQRKGDGAVVAWDAASELEGSAVNRHQQQTGNAHVRIN